MSAWYEATYPRLWSWVRRVVGDPGVASDIAQEAFVRLLQSERDSLPESERAPYLFTIARNLMRDHWKRAARGEELGLGEDVRSLASSITRDVALSIDLERALDALTPQERSIVWLAYAEGFSHREIASVLGMKTASVKLLLFRARRKLAGILRAQPEQAGQS